MLTTQGSWAGSKPSPTPMSGNATFTTVMSRVTMNWARATAINACPLFKAVSDIRPSRVFLLVSNTRKKTLAGTRWVVTRCRSEALCPGRGTRTEGG